MSTFIYALDINAKNLKAPNVPKEITSPKGEKYTRTYLSYNYGTLDKPYLAEALFELRICKAKVKLNKKKEHKLNAIITDPADLKGLTELSLGFAYCVESYKNKFGLRNFDPQHPGDLRGSFFYPASEDGELIAGASPIVSLKMNEKTKFKVLKPKINPGTNEPIMLPNGSPDFEEELIDYKTLVDKQLDCSIIFNARDLYRSSGTPLPQMFVRSCMILNMSDSGEVEHAKSEVVRNFLQQNPDALNTLLEQIAKLKTGTAGSTSLLQSANAPKSDPIPAVNALPEINTQSPTRNLPQVNTTSGISSPAPIQIPASQSGLPHVNTSLPGQVSMLPNPGQTFQLPMPQSQMQPGGLDC